MLAMAWCTSQLAGFLYPDGRPPTPVQAAALAAEAPLEAWLGNPDAAAFRALHAPKLSALPPEQRALYDQARAALSLKPGARALPAAQARAAAEDFLAKLQATPMDEARRRHLAAELLRDTRGLRRIDGAVAGMLHNFTEGGAGMQVAAALSLVVTAWLFGRSLRHDARFPRAAAGGALYLYYGTALLFWFSVASIVAYGVLAFASASGNTTLFERAGQASQAVAAVSTLYLLLFSRRFALALRDDAALPRNATLAIAWKLLWTQLASFALLMAAALLAGTLAGVAAAFWFMRG